MNVYEMCFLSKCVYGSPQVFFGPLQPGTLIGNIVSQQEMTMSLFSDSKLVVET
jgi:hypothetical protein